MQNLCAVRSSASNIDPVIICIIRMSVPKRQVIGNPSFCLVAFGVVPGGRYTEGLKTATPTKADLIYHTIYAYFQFTLAYINMVPGIAKKLSYCETRRSRVIIFARTRHLLWQFSPVRLSVISWEIRQKFDTFWKGLGRSPVVHAVIQQDCLRALLLLH